jgi:hypothetical protein
MFGFYRFYQVIQPRQNISIFQPFLDSLCKLVCKRRFPIFVSSFVREGCDFGVSDYQSAARLGADQ